MQDKNILLIGALILGLGFIVSLLFIKASFLYIPPTIRISDENTDNNELTEKTLLASISRGVCFGTCPVYQVNIYSDGSVIYNGEMHVKEKGERTSTLSKKQLQMLIKEFEAVDYFNLGDSYKDFGATDMPTVVTSFNHEGKSKRIENYHGDLSAPKNLIILENNIDEIVGTQKWIKGEEISENPNKYICPKGWVNCMPMSVGDSRVGSPNILRICNDKQYQSWAEQNCKPDFKGIAY